MPAQAWVLHADPLLRILLLQNVPQLGEFRPSQFFSFFTWGEIRRISPQRARASRLLLAIS
jgi:hypothetical protein